MDWRNIVALATILIIQVSYFFKFISLINYLGHYRPLDIFTSVQVVDGSKSKCTYLESRFLFFACKCF